MYMYTSIHSGVYLRIPALGRLRQENCFKYDDSLGYRLRGRPDHVSKPKMRQKNPPKNQKPNHM